MKSFMIFMSSGFAFWLGELLLFISLRMIHNRRDYARWNHMTTERRQILMLLLGLWMLVGFALTQRVNATLLMTAPGYVFNFISVVILPWGAAAALTLLWWFFHATMKSGAKRFWFVSTVFGLAAGLTTLLSLT